MDEKLLQILVELTKIEADPSVPKNVRAKVKNAICALEEDGKQIEVKIDKVLEELSDIDDDPNVQQYTRTQIWGIVSALEVK